MHEENYFIQDEMEDPLAYLSSSDPDTMESDQAMEESYRKEFLNAAIKEVNSHWKTNQWKLHPSSSVPKGQPILDSVWDMNRKRDIMTRQVYKCKASLSLNVGQKEYGVNYFNIYLHVIMWFSTRTLLTLTVINKWHSRKVDSLLAYPQAPIEYDLYMEWSKSFQTKEGNACNHVLRLLKNLYGQK